jgi:hypothetical protein
VGNVVHPHRQPRRKIEPRDNVSVTPAEIGRRDKSHGELVDKAVDSDPHPYASSGGRPQSLVQHLPRQPENMIDIVVLERRTFDSTQSPTQTDCGQPHGVDRDFQRDHHWSRGSWAQAGAGATPSICRFGLRHRDQAEILKVRRQRCGCRPGAGELAGELRPSQVNFRAVDSAKSSGEIGLAKLSGS